MGMTAEGQRDIGFWYHLLAPLAGIMSEEEGEPLIANRFKSLSEVTTLDDGVSTHTLVLASKDGNAVITPTDDIRFIEQNLPPQLFPFHADQFLHGSLSGTKANTGIGQVIMIAQDGIDSPPLIRRIGT